jgi:hypothetical protein
MGLAVRYTKAELEKNAEFEKFYKFLYSHIYGVSIGAVAYFKYAKTVNRHIFIRIARV